MRFGLIGAGLIGEKRAAHLAPHTLVAVADASAARAEKLAGAYKARSFSDSQAVLNHPEVEAVLICTTHDALTPMAISALRAGKHVLVEKPAGRYPEELKQLVAAEKASGKILRVGFNHRFHPAFLALHEHQDKDHWGSLLYIRARYGHGGRLGYEKEWRADREKSGGGELMDQGVHLIDLARWIGGEFNLAWGRAETFFWNMAVEDNGFLFLESPDGQRNALLHASCTEWKNLFDFEVFYKNAKAEVFGLGRSYGEEELRIYSMKPQMGPPDLEVLRFPGEDLSWKAELEAFVQEIQGTRTVMGTAHDALRAVEIVHSVYSSMKIEK